MPKDKSQGIDLAQGGGKKRCNHAYERLFRASGLDGAARAGLAPCRLNDNIDALLSGFEI